MESALSFINTKLIASWWGAFAGFCGGAFGYIFGGCAESIAWLFCVMLVDFALGTIVACKNGQWNSHDCRMGMVSKFFILVLCAAGYGLDHAAHTSFIQSTFIALFLFSEVGSVIENLDLLGYSNVIPKGLRDFLKQMEQKQLKGK